VQVSLTHHAHFLPIAFHHHFAASCAARAKIEQKVARMT
jgi:hypothetical protein